MMRIAAGSPAVPWGAPPASSVARTSLEPDANTGEVLPARDVVQHGAVARPRDELVVHLVGQDHPFKRELDVVVHAGGERGIRMARAVLAVDLVAVLTWHGREERLPRGQRAQPPVV